MERLLGIANARFRLSTRIALVMFDASLDAAFQKLMAKSPEGRPQTMGQAIAELESCLPSPPGEKTKRAVPRKRSDSRRGRPRLRL